MSILTHRTFKDWFGSEIMNPLCKDEIIGLNGIQSITMPSETVDDMSYSIKEIAQRFTRGQQLPSIGMRDPIYLDEDTPDPMRDGNFDLADATAMQVAIALEKEARDNERKQSEEEAKRSEVPPSDNESE